MHRPGIVPERSAKKSVNDGTLPLKTRVGVSALPKKKKRRVPPQTVENGGSLCEPTAQQQQTQDIYHNDDDCGNDNDDNTDSLRAQGAALLRWLLRGAISCGATTTFTPENYPTTVSSSSFSPSAPSHEKHVKGTSKRDMRSSAVFLPNAFPNCDDFADADVRHFFDNYFDQRPLHISRRKLNSVSVAAAATTNTMTVDGEMTHPRVHPCYYFQRVDGCAGNLLTKGIEWSAEGIRQAVREGDTYDAKTNTRYATDTKDFLKPPASPLQHGTYLNIVRFDPQKQRRVMFKTEGPVTLPEYDACIANGWSVQFLRPQEHSLGLSHLLSLFDVAMGCNAGMNSYLTPPPRRSGVTPSNTKQNKSGSTGGSVGSTNKQQGLAPHFDDVDVFMLQLEGRKRWRLYYPPQPSDWLASHYSNDFTQAELGPCAMTLELHPGDLLYLPRGMIHQGDVSSNEGDEVASLHITLSANQEHTVAHLLSAVMQNQVLMTARKQSVLRRSIPRLWPYALGAARSTAVLGPYGHPPLEGTPEAATRSALLVALRTGASAVLDALVTAGEDGPYDRGVDEFAKGVLRRRQPPPHVTGSGHKQGTNVATKRLREEGSAGATTSQKTRIRVVGDPQVAQLVIPPGAKECQLHHCAANSLICLGPPTGATMLRFAIDYAPAIATILAAPRSQCQHMDRESSFSPSSIDGGVPISKLPFPDAATPEDANEDRRTVVEALVASGAFELC